MNSVPPSVRPRIRHILSAALAGGMTMAAADVLFSDVLLHGATQAGLLLAQVLLGFVLFTVALVATGVLASTLGLRDCTATPGAMGRAAFVLATVVVLCAFFALIQATVSRGGFALTHAPVLLVLALPAVMPRVVNGMLPGAGNAAARKLMLLLPLALAAVIVASAFARLPGDRGAVSVGLCAVLLVLVGVSARAVVRRPRVRYVTIGFGGMCGLLGVAAMPVFPSGAARALAASPAPAGPPQVKRVILLTVDTLRRDALDRYASDAPRTPALSALAADSVLFEQALSPAPWTLPAFASIHTGVLPDVHGATRFDRPLPAAFPTLAERMRAAGYRTAAIGYNPFLTAPYGLDRGFERYDMFPRLASGGVASRVVQWAAPDHFGREADAADITRLSLRWIQRHAAEPFFLWIHYFDPHLPYAPPPEFAPAGEPPPRIGGRFDSQRLESVRGGYFVPTAAEIRWIRALYDAEVRYTDAQIGRLLAELKRRGLYEDTLIVFTSDHGEEFWEHGGFEHGHSVHDEVIGVPLVLKLPRPYVRQRVTAPVSTVALSPTILQLCGLPAAPHVASSDSLSWSGSDAAGSYQQDMSTPEHVIVSTGCAYYENKTALRFGEWKSIQSDLSPTPWFFNISDDPGERMPHSATSVPHIKRLAGDLLRAHAAAVAARRAQYAIDRRGPGADLAESQLRQLRTLGYVE